MAMPGPEPSPPAWTCPSCERVVPGRIRQCRCGFDAGPADDILAVTGGTVEDEAPGRTWLWLVLVVVAGAAAAFYYTRPAPSELPASTQVA